MLLGTLLVYLLGVVVGALDQGQMKRGHAICSAYGHKLVDAKFGKESHLLCLKLKAIGM
jgi:hypothetical protein